MNEFLNILKLLLIAITYFVLVETVFVPPKYELLNICDQKISISEDMILSLSVNDTSKGPHHCQVSIESDVGGDKLLVQVEDIDMPTSPGCNETSVRITGIEGNHEAGILCGSNSSTHVFNSTGQSVHVTYRTNGQVKSASNASLSLLVSSFHDGHCSSYEFACSNLLCIDDDMTCNGYDDCSDDSDETIGCQKPPSQHILEIVSLSVVGGIFLITVIVVCYVKIRRAHAKGGKYLPIS